MDFSFFCPRTVNLLCLFYIDKGFLLFFRFSAVGHVFSFCSLLYMGARLGRGWLCALGAEHVGGAYKKRMEEEGGGGKRREKEGKRREEEGGDGGEGGGGGGMDEMGKGERTALRLGRRARGRCVHAQEERSGCYAPPVNCVYVCGGGN